MWQFVGAAQSDTFVLVGQAESRDVLVLAFR